jgi:hypothetical protein
MERELRQFAGINDETATAAEDLRKALADIRILRMQMSEIRNAMADYRSRSAAPSESERQEWLSMRLSLAAVVEWVGAVLKQVSDEARTLLPMSFFALGAIAGELEAWLKLTNEFFGTDSTPALPAPVTDKEPSVLPFRPVTKQ